MDTKTNKIPDIIKAIITVLFIAFAIASFFLKSVRIYDYFTLIRKGDYTQNITIFEMFNMNGVGIKPNVGYLMWVMTSCVAGIVLIWLDKKKYSLACSVLNLCFMLCTVFGKGLHLSNPSLWYWKPYSGYIGGTNENYRYMTFSRYLSGYYVIWGLAVITVISLAIVSFFDFNKIETSKKGLQSSTITAEELLKYKDLLDSGAITKEEFTAIKKKALSVNEETK